MWFVAAIVPSLLLGVFYLSIQVQERNRNVEDKTVDRAVSYMALADIQLAAELGALSVLAGSQSFRSGAPDEARSRAIAVANDFPRWKNVILTDASAREEIWQTAASAARAPARAYALDFAARDSVSEVGGVDGKCACIRIHRRLAEPASSYVVTVEREVSDLQALLVARKGAGEIAALVDRESLFIARTAQHDLRLGTPATEFVRKAVERGGNGIYSGVTYEGLRNRTAYATSDLSGWSTHFAVPAKSYNLLSTGSTSLALLAVIAALLFAGGVTWYGVRDLTMRRRQERARMQSYKLEAIGNLSSAVAHDFNNLLSIVTACFRSLSRPDDRLKSEQVIQEGLSAVDRGAKLVTQLLTFARDKPPEISCIDLSATIDGIRDLLARSLGQAIILDVTISSDAQNVSTNGSQLELVLINLAVNARDAMPEGGTFSIASNTSSVPGCIDVLIRDTGIGMSEEVAARAFDPFFTTKPEGKGTGLGLAQAHLLAKDSGGSLHLETSPGKGALFTWRFNACRP